LSRVYLVLPHEDLQDGFVFARKCFLQCFARGELPLNLNFAYGNVLDMKSTHEVAMVDRAIVEWMELCPRVICYTDRDVNLRMNLELEWAKLRKLPIEFRRLVGGRPSSEGMHFRGIHHSPEDCTVCLGPQRMEELKRDGLTPEELLQRSTLPKKEDG
jgi:hypothetical protein